MQQNRDQDLNKKIISELATRLMNRTDIEHDKIYAFTKNLSGNLELLENLRDRRNYTTLQVENPLNDIALSAQLNLQMTKELVNNTLEFFKNIRGAKTIEELEEKIDQNRPMAVLQPQIHPIGEQDNQNGCCVIS